ncbi:hypothetical protein K470DRAFT_93091 [Piedraia hortae CBS 480.64]|uniref:PH domain-containing protein n=1 Tax=Piedraia hortae CBS 480.64 TaxID=1314780 RepID=A0A6A7BYY9_9PEZI|nr:hypothetical protein K470DRAFT_93091 [Piedraia hortae CBS 480.64]
MATPQRYRSQRRAQEAEDALSRSRSRSRYHRAEARPSTAPSPSPSRPVALPGPQPTGDLFPPPRPPPPRDGPPTSDQIRATASVVQLVPEDEHRGCFGLFRRRRGRPTAQEKDSRRSPVQTRTVLSDAPHSAVNGGERVISVEYGRESVLLPVTATTTPTDLIRLAAERLQAVNIRSAVLLEHFRSVGVQRPLRRYERIRDVMNSWDGDSSNALILVDPGVGRSEAELGLAGVPRLRPSQDLTWVLSYSQQVGKWDKRVVTLKSDGQITVGRDGGAAQNVCHLSDFDIYSPTADKVKRKIRPPKRICYAIKSQERASVFESTRLFVHFFCTNDRLVGDEFYAAVQGWRSWYLAQQVKTSRPPAPAAPVIPTVAGGFTKSASQFDTTASPERRLGSTRNHQAAVLTEDEPLGNFQRSLSVRAQSLKGSVSESERQRSQSTPRRTNNTTSLSRTSSQRANTLTQTVSNTTSRRGASRTDPTRTASTRSTRPPSPLVDLTPTYREPPQHVKKGRPVAPAKNGAALILSATSPDDPIGVPGLDVRGRR